MQHPDSDRGQRCRCPAHRRAARTARASTLIDDARGVLLIEAILVYVPVALFFFLTWQLGELVAADLVLARAATAAAREAAVVLPDDPQHYAGEAPLDAQAPLRRAAVEAAARSVLAAAPSFDAGSLELDLVLVPGPASGVVLLDTRLRADFRCSGGGLSLVVCGASNRRTLNAVARDVVHSARYAYSGERPSGRN